MTLRMRRGSFLDNSIAQARAVEVVRASGGESSACPYGYPFFNDMNRQAIVVLSTANVRPC